MRLVTVPMVKLWLDDIRDPAKYGHEGWTWVKNVASAQSYLKAGDVEEASLDHDLGACKSCMEGMTEWEWLERSGGQSMPHCPHFGDGTQLCNWMAETGNWPRVKPRVHSANPVGRERMRGIIERYFPSIESAE